MGADRMAGAMAGMMGRGMMGGLRTSSEDTKKQITTLTRTDFLLQFVWKPLTPEEQPKTDEERLSKYKEIKTKMEEFEKNHPAVVMPKSEEIESASLKQSEAINSAINKALNGPSGPGGAGPGGAAPPGAAANPAPVRASVPLRAGRIQPPATKGATSPPPR